MALEELNFRKKVYKLAEDIGNLDYFNKVIVIDKDLTVSDLETFIKNNSDEEGKPKTIMVYRSSSEFEDEELSFNDSLDIFRKNKELYGILSVLDHEWSLVIIEDAIDIRDFSYIISV